MLQINSLKAEQRVTIHCENVEVTPSFEGFKRGSIFSLDENTVVASQLLYDGCSVSSKVSHVCVYTCKVCYVHDDLKLGCDNFI